MASFLKPVAPVNASAATFHYKSIEEYHAAFLSGAVTPLQIAERILEFLANDKNVLNAVPELNAEDVLQQARESTARYQAKSSLGIAILLRVRIN